MNFRPAICRPFFSKRVRISPQSPRWTASGLKMISVRSMGSVLWLGWRGLYRMGRGKPTGAGRSEERELRSEKEDHGCRRAILLASLLVTRFSLLPPLLRLLQHHVLERHLHRRAGVELEGEDAGLGALLGVVVGH